MKIIQPGYLTIEQKSAIYNIWNEVYPLRLKYNTPEEFDSYLDKLTNQHHYLLTDNEDRVNGWAFLFEREADTWFAILLRDVAQGKGYGTMLLNEMKKHAPKLSGWVVDHSTDPKQNGALYLSPMDFYLKNGFQVMNGVRLETEKISAVKIEWTSKPV